MFYKELHSARRKYFPILLIYLLVGVVVSTLFNVNFNFPMDSIFHSWVTGLLYLTVGAAILGGSDIFAEETGNNTIGFLLTRPFSRTRIYTVKFLVSAGLLSAVVIVTSLVMFLVEQTPQKYVFSRNLPDGRTVFNSYEPSKMPAGEAFTDITAILGLGLVVLAITTIISIFCRSTLQAMIATILLIIGLVAVFAFTDSFLFRLTYGMTPMQIQALYNWLGVGAFVVLAGMATGIFAIGLRIFKAREF